MYTNNELKNQFSSVTQSCLNLCDPMGCSTPALPVHHQLPRFTQTHVHQVGDAIQPSHPVIPFSSCLQSFPASGSFQMSQLFASVLEFQLQHQSFQWIFRDWFPLGWTAESPWSPRSLPQYQSSKASILQRSAFFIVQLSYPYKTGGKIIALTWQAFLSKVMSLLFNIQSRFVIAFLPRSKRLLIS